MINYQKFIAISFCLFSFSASQAKTISVPSSESFRGNVAQLQQCYMNKQTTCGSKNIAHLYMSDNPKSHWKTITRNSSSHSTALPQLPSNISYNAPQAQQTARSTPARKASAPATTNSSIFMPNDDTGATGFVVG